MEAIVNSVLAAMSSVKKPQRLFLIGLFSVLTLFQGKASFRNPSRYSEMPEKRFPRGYRRIFDFAQFNARLRAHEWPEDHERRAAMDARFMKKSGQHTEGWATFTLARQATLKKAWRFRLFRAWL
ncbi:MAG: hypothetical protein PHG00_16875 [Methylococcales bacterium]|nr:hypothetical protein [Methylococcales bacterium]